MMDIQKINDSAKALFDKKDFRGALELLSSVDLPTELIPNLAKCYYYTRRADKALELILPLRKEQGLLIDTALYYNALGMTDRAYEIYTSLDQSDPKVKFNLGWHLLSRNQFRSGFEHLQYGAQCSAWGHEYIHLKTGKLSVTKRWNGSKCRHLVLILEGGLGDEMIFVRWANYLASKCDKLSVVCSDGLQRLLINSGYDCIPFQALEHFDYDYYVPAMSLPAIAGLDHPQQHVQFPYIKSFAERYVGVQMDRVAGGRKKIGVRFYGNPEFEHDQFRTPPREALESLSRYGQLFSLQLDESDSSTLPNCKYLIRDWQDTYSVFSSLDLLVTSCTSTAHLAGAMGTRVIVLVPLVPYFVWASDDLKWYPDNLTIIRQTKYNCWNEPVEKLHHELSRLCSDKAEGRGSRY
jgi:tetratricopeptide (TPR) repeat protein